ncbi:branched-chain amino acid ABC transporter permease [Teichococcus aestuarii]|uniref:branched-chain amino acid ABC transporter permease n=1 Tax=Teichococcus aestuarii TaxID=568898 RepID=UPI00361E0E31
MEIVFLIEQILNGLLIGAYYLLIALGLSLIFSLGGIVNLAHGAFYAIGAYLTVALAPTIGFGGAFVAAPVLVALLGLVIERFLLRRFYRADPILSLLLTFGRPWWRSRRCAWCSARRRCPSPSRSRCAARCSSAISSIPATG